MSELTFADMFAGIGGFRIGFERAGFRCVYTCEIDKKARQTYEINHDVDHDFHDDITTATNIPDHDVLVGGFPCQSFSVLGKRGGTDDPRGIMFWQLVRILREKKPRAFLFENVKGIASFGIIPEMYRMVEDAGYTMQHRELSGVGYVPQVRRRMFFWGQRKDQNGLFAWPQVPSRKLWSLRDILEIDPVPEFSMRKVDALKNDDEAWARIKPRYPWRDPYATLSALHTQHYFNEKTEYMTGATNILIDEPRWRLLTKREYARAMGFPDNFILPERDTDCFKQLGNSVIVPLVADIAESVRRSMVGEMPREPAQLAMF